jgi:hypothetical protein
MEKTNPTINANLRDMRRTLAIQVGSMPGIVNDLVGYGTTTGLFSRMHNSQTWQYFCTIRYGMQSKYVARPWNTPSITTA